MATTELDLVNNVDLRFALAESDSQLEQSLNQLLPPLLLKLSSQDAQVRQAVFKVIQNIFPRITAAPTLQLPVDALLQQIKAPMVNSQQDSNTVRLYSLLFLSKGVERLSQESQRKLVPSVVSGISSLPTSSAARMFNILVKLLQNWVPPSRDSPEYECMASTLGFDKNKSDEKFIADKVARFMLLVPTSSSTHTALPGLSASEIAFFTKDAGVTYSTSQELVSAKIRLLNFLKAGFSDQRLVFPLLVASVDSLSTIAEASETLFRKLEIDYHDDELVSLMTSLFLGTNALPVKSTLQCKILSLLVKFPPEKTSAQAAEIADVGLTSDYRRLRLDIVRFIKLSTLNMDSSIEDKELNCVKIAAKLKMNIIADGWPQMNTSNGSEFHHSLKQRELQYETLGDLLSSSASFLLNNLDYLEFLFESLDSEMVDLRSVLQLVLSRLSVHISQLTDDRKIALMPIFESIILKENANSAVKYLALKYVNTAYEFCNLDARYLCILGTSLKNSPEAIEEAKKGLNPYQFSLIQASSASYALVTPTISEELKFPQFQALVSLYSLKLESSFLDSKNNQLKDCITEAIIFAFRVLATEAIGTSSFAIVIDERWATRVDDALEHDETVGKLISSHMLEILRDNFQMTGDVVSRNAIQSFIDLTFSSLHSRFVSNQMIVPSFELTKVFHLLLKFSDEGIINYLDHTLLDLHKILEQCSNFNDSLRTLAKSFAIIASSASVSVDVPLNLISALSKIRGSISSIEIYLFTSSAIYSRLAARGRLHQVESSDINKLLDEIESSLQSPQLYDASLLSISELSIYGVMSNLEILSGYQNWVERIHDLIAPRAKACHELSLLAICKLSLSAKSSPENDQSLQPLPIESLVFETHHAKNTEFAFVSGECLLILAGGWNSKILRQELDIQGVIPENRPQLVRFEIILNECIKFSRMTKPSLRKSSCIWLLEIVQNLGHTQLIKDRALELHSVFISFLTDRDEMIQECASRGLGLTFELGNSELKESLVKNLIRSFTDTVPSNSMTLGSVQGDTQLFDNDVMRTHDGSVSTYKDVLNLASDVGDPSLVYKFMSLAKANAAWTTKRGMAFGLGNILSKSNLDSVFLQDKNLILRLVPKLYRYRFDPNGLVSQSMNGIWNALFPDSSTLVTQNFDSILREILSGMGNREWRVRQASISAMENLLQSQLFEKYEQNLEEIWNMTFRCMDDIKESVRKEAQKLAKSLSKTLLRAADPSTGNLTVAKATKLVGQVIPFLLGSNGLLSDAEDVKHFALETLIKLSEKGGKAIRPFIPELIATFIELMSSLEPEVINYLVLNAEKYNLSGNDVDAKRLQSLNSSPLLEAIEKLISLVDEDLMSDLVQKLRDSIRNSVGLPSKACGSRVIVHLVTKLPFLSGPYGDDLLKICVSNLKDRNLAISSSFAIAAGHCSKIASIDSVVRYSAKISDMYFTNKDNKDRFIAAVASQSVSKFSGVDKFSAVAVAFLPLSFIGKHDDDEKVQKRFEDEWVESSSGNSAVKLYFDEILQICESQIKCSDYNIRRIVARSLIEIVETVHNSLHKEIMRLFEVLLLGCQEKSWKGKEFVFDALVQLSVRNRSTLDQNDNLMESVVKTVKTEAKRRNKSYQIHAVQSMGRFIKVFYSDKDLVHLYIDIMESVLSDEYLEEIDLLDEKHRSAKSLVSQHAVKNEELYISLLKSVGDSISPSIDEDLAQFLVRSMRSFMNSEHEISWRTCIAYNEIYKSLMEPCLQSQSGPMSFNSVYQLFTLLRQFKEPYKLERAITLLIRNAGLSLLVFRKFDQTKYFQEVSAMLLDYQKQDQSSVVRAEIDKALI